MEFQYQNRTFTYVITRRNMKTIRVHVKEDGIIHVSAPHAASERYIREFLLQNAAELAALIDKAKAQKAAASDCSDGAVIPYLGRAVTLRWQDTPCPSVLENDTLRLFARNASEAGIAVRQWMIAQCVELYRQINREVYEAFHRKGYQVPAAHIQIKEMTSRWGSCTAATGRISMNFRLLQYPRECIYGVFCHEYAHFLHQDHSENFYAVLLDVYPDYRQFDALLKHPPL